MLSPSVQLRLLWESWDQAAAGAERPKGGRWRLELCDEMMEPPSAKKKIGKSPVCCPGTVSWISFCRRRGPEEARIEPGSSPPD